VRQVLGAISQFEKANIAAKLKGARERIRATGIKCGGRRSHSEARPEVVALARQLRRKRPKGKRMSYGAIAAELAARGHLNEAGRPYAAMSVFNMVQQEKTVLFKAAPR
jgi:DNA invertase Pin-like site-specific DNA recombinase